MVSNPCADLFHRDYRDLALLVAQKWEKRLRASKRVRHHRIDPFGIPGLRLPLETGYLSNAKNG